MAWCMDCLRQKKPIRCNGWLVQLKEILFLQINPVGLWMIMIRYKYIFNQKYTFKILNFELLYIYHTQYLDLSFWMHWIVPIKKDCWNTCHHILTQYENFDDWLFFIQISKCDSGQRCQTRRGIQQSMQLEIKATWNFTWIWVWYSDQWKRL